MRSSPGRWKLNSLPLEVSFPSPSRMYPLVAPFLLAWKVMVIGSPGFRLVRFQPTRISHSGLYSSIVQCRTSPASLLASKCRRQCGLLQSRQIGRASCRERVELSVVAGRVKKKREVYRAQKEDG